MSMQLGEYDTCFVAMNFSEVVQQRIGHEREAVKPLEKKVGCNDPCPCGSEKKLEKCCGTAADMH